MLPNASCTVHLDHLGPFFVNMTGPETCERLRRFFWGMGNHVRQVLKIGPQNGWSNKSNIAITPQKMWLNDWNHHKHLIWSPNFPSRFRSRTNGQVATEPAMHLPSSSCRLVEYKSPEPVGDPRRTGVSELLLMGLPSGEHTNSNGKWP